jgi:trans-aconitate methyltransferase
MVPGATCRVPAVLAALEVTPNASFLDVGGGASRLVDHLIAAGYTDVTVLDLSQAALDVAGARLPEAPVNWVCADVTTWEPERTWDVWHDRAVLYFLVDEGSRAAYQRTMRHALNPGGAIVIGTFAEDGPTQCSNLEVRRYSQAELVELLGETFEPLQVQRIMHQTPGRATQPFNWVAGRARA